MRHALALAERGLGNVWPNPAVGSIIVADDGEVLGRGWTQPGGRPHAETVALGEAGDRARNATAYVTLEPCAHHGQTPPCAEALVKAGVRRVVVAADDPDPRVAGRGYDILTEAGIEVVRGIGREQAEAVNAGFLMAVKAGRPMVTLKLATSLDGRIATRSGESKWITGSEARQAGHRLRASHDAILVGIGTALADDPSLTCRLPGLQKRSPIRVVLDSKGRLGDAAALVKTARDVPTWVITTAAGQDQIQRLEDAGVETEAVAADAEARPDLQAVLAALQRRGITRLLIEGGAGVARSFLSAGLVDRLVWFRAGSVIGGDGLAAIGPLGIEALDETPRFALQKVQRLGQDLLETYQSAR
jgi:diaminohydroxyphosphoribosylaminopyrimidine deaminase/5-amino-6-(5-phosphoribosylamino)uracil reductase